MEWTCQGESFDDILLALQTSQISERSPEALLLRKGEIGWEALWQELDLAGPTPAGSAD